MSREALDRARSGDAHALGQLLESHRGVVRAAARRHLHPILRGKLDVADVFQETALAVVRLFARFHGDSLTEFEAWLRALAERRCLYLNRRYLDVQKRDARREVPLHLHTHTHTQPALDLRRSPVGRVPVLLGGHGMT